MDPGHQKAPGGGPPVPVHWNLTPFRAQKHVLVLVRSPQSPPCVYGSDGPGGDSGGPEGLIRSALGALGAPYKDQNTFLA